MGAILINALSVILLSKSCSALISWDSACGSTKGCFPDCTGGCEYLVTWQNTGSNIQFTLKAEESETNVYLAIGFSDDYRMGEDSVVGCLVPGSPSAVYSYYNEDTDSEELSDKSLGLSAVSVAQSNGVITCSFTRTYSATDDKFFDLKNNQYILMLVIGEAESEGGSYKMEEHHMIPWSSDGKVNFLNHEIVSAYKLNSPLVKLHAIMMVLAWLLLCIVGIVTARYNKNMLPERKLFGTKVWFQVHRGAMVTALVFVVIGFIPIFVEIEGYSQITEQESVSGGAAHPVLGIIVTVLCFANPIMALFRPDADHKFRWIFNWAHFTVGVVGQILAIVTILIGYLLERANLSRSAVWVTVAHLVVSAAVIGGLELHKWLASKKTKESVRDSKIDLGNGVNLEEKTETKEPSKPSNLPVIVLAVFAVMAFAFAIAVLAIIAAS